MQIATNSPARAMRNADLDAWISNNAVCSLLSPSTKADASCLFHISFVLERAAQRKYHGVDLSIWTPNDAAAASLTIKPMSDHPLDPASVALPLSLPGSGRMTSGSASTPPTARCHHPPPTPPVRPTCPVHLQLSCNEGSEMIGFNAIELRKGPLPPNTRLLFQGTFYPEPKACGGIQCGYFVSSKPLYRVFTDPASSTADNLINSLSARILVPEPTRTEMPPLCPEIIEQIFASCCVRSCDWPGCRIHAKMNLFLLAQVCTDWLHVARRMHQTRENVARKLIDACTTFEYSHPVSLPDGAPPPLEPRTLFSISTIFEALSAKPFAGVQLYVSVYGSDLPSPDIVRAAVFSHPDADAPQSVEWVGHDGKGLTEEQKAEEDAIRAEPHDVYYPLHLRLDTWNSLEGITAYSMGSAEPSWSSREIFQKKFSFQRHPSAHLGWFRISKPIFLDRDITGSLPTHFAARISAPSPARQPLRELPMHLLERIFCAAWSPHEEVSFAAMQGAGLWPGLATLPNYAWSSELKRYASVCKGWASIAKKLYRFEILLGQVSGYTHASCFSFGDSVQQPNYLFAVSLVFEGEAVKRFQGASLVLCVPEEGVWSDVSIQYAGETFNGKTIENVESSSASVEPSSPESCVCDSPTLPLSLCLCTSQDDSDSYHVSIRNFPNTRNLCTRKARLEPGTNTVFFGYFTCSRPFTGSALSAIPFHVIRVSLPEPKKKRFPKLPDAVIHRIAEGVTELSDGVKRTGTWADNLRSMAAVNRQWRKHASDVAWQLANPLGADVVLTAQTPITPFSA